MDNLEFKVLGIKVNISLKSVLKVIVVLIGAILVVIGIVSKADFHNIIDELKEWFNL